MVKVINTKVVLDKLHKLIEEHGGVRQLSESLDVSDEAIYMVVRGTRPPTGRVLKATGYKKVTRYIPIETEPE